MTSAFIEVSEIHGATELLALLTNLPAKLQRRLIRTANNKAGSLLVKAAKRNIRKGPGRNFTGQKRKHLRQSVSKKTSTNKRKGQILTRVGIKTEDKQLHAIWVHEGTHPHLIRLRKRKAFKIGDRFLGGVIQHPGATANPYMRDALNDNRTQVVQTMMDAIVSSIEKERLKK